MQINPLRIRFQNYSHEGKQTIKTKFRVKRSGLFEMFETEKSGQCFFVICDKGCKFEKDCKGPAERGYEREDWLRLCQLRLRVIELT